MDALYTLGDINAEINGLHAHPMRALDTDDDIGLVDDVIDALLDPAQSEVARPILRDALARIAQHALLGTAGANDRVSGEPNGRSPNPR